MMGREVGGGCRARCNELVLSQRFSLASTGFAEGTREIGASKRALRRRKKWPLLTKPAICIQAQRATTKLDQNFYKLVGRQFEF